MTADLDGKEDAVSEFRVFGEEPRDELEISCAGVQAVELSGIHQEFLILGNEVDSGLHSLKGLFIGSRSGRPSCPNDRQFHVR